MAEKTPQKRTSATATTTPRGTTPSGSPLAPPPLTRPSGQARTPSSAFESEYEAAIYGLDIFTGYTQPGKGQAGPAGPAQYKSAQALFEGWFRHSDPWIRKMQRKMWEAGLYGDVKWSDVNQGAKDDDATLKAYTILLRSVGTRAKFGDNITREAWLEERAKHLAENGLTPGATAGDEIAPFRYQPAQDTETLRRTLDSGMTDILGRKLSPEERDAIVRKYEQAAYAAARSAYDVGVSDAGGVAMAKPDLGTIALAEAERLHPDEVHAKKLATLSEQFLAAIQGDTQADRVF